MYYGFLWFHLDSLLLAKQRLDLEKNKTGIKIIFLCGYGNDEKKQNANQ